MIALRTNIESIQKDVEVATTILGLARYSDDYSRSAGPSMMFAKDITDHPDSRNQIIRQPNDRAAAPAAIEDLSFAKPEFNLGI